MIIFIKMFNLLVQPKKEYHIHHLVGCGAYDYCEEHGKYDTLYPDKTYKAKFNPNYKQGISIMYDNKCKERVNWTDFNILNYNLKGYFTDNTFDTTVLCKAIEADETRYLVEYNDWVYQVPRCNFRTIV